MDATILHADLDSFYAAVEQRDNPSLLGRPVIVGGGVVLAASYEAKAFGVRAAMNRYEAARRCPHAIVVEPRMAAYTTASRAVFDVFHRHRQTVHIDLATVRDTLLYIESDLTRSPELDRLAGELRSVDHIGAADLVFEFASSFVEFFQ